LLAGTATVNLAIVPFPALFCIDQSMTTQLIERTVFVVSDSTGITAETFSNSVLSQFEEVKFEAIRVPFLDSMEKAQDTARRINRCADEQNAPPLVFSTLVDPQVAAVIQAANCTFMDLFGTFVQHIETALGVKSSHSVGRSHMGGLSKQYNNRIEAINFSLAHDDGQFVHGLEQADVILVGVSRCGKTPTSLYLAMQYAVKAANYPLIPEDFDRGSLPATLAPFRSKLFGLSIQPERLAEVRHERRPNSQYCSIKQCREEVAEAERLMRMENIPWLSTTTRSIEEISTKVLDEVGLNRRMY
jgi:regulator of PEP synthase PpsR (kinase-PPPase family)